MPDLLTHYIMPIETPCHMRRKPANRIGNAALDETISTLFSDKLDAPWTMSGMSAIKATLESLDTRVSLARISISILRINSGRGALRLAH